MMLEPKNPLIVALDVATPERALELVQTLGPHVALFKVGLELYTAAGPSIVRNIIETGAHVFLDLKLHDIPNTAGRAAVQAARLGCTMMTLHALGGERMMAQARQMVHEQCEQQSCAAPKLLAVTVLTSLDQAELNATGIHRPLKEMVTRLAMAAKNAGLDGVVASPRELPLLKRDDLRGLLVVTPGIRPASSIQPTFRDDQARTMAAAEALQQGADYIVVGRPITQASDPLASTLSLLEEIRRAKMISG